MALEHPYAAQNAEATARLRALADRLSEADLRRDLGGGWTVSAALAHLAFWDRRVAAILGRWQREGAPSPSPMDDNPTNEALTPIWAAVPPRDAVRLALESAEAADAALASLSEDLAAAAQEADSPLNPRRYEHRTEHIEQIERALRG